MIDNAFHVGRHVRLLVDLSAYHRAFGQGVEGIVVRAPAGELDHFFRMELPTGEQLRVVVTSAELVEGDR